MSSNFWASRLGVNPQPPAAPQPVYQQPQVPQQPAAAPRPWWANDYYAPTPPVPQQAPVEQQVPVEQHQGWGTIEGSKRKAKSSRSTETCPECGSTNYFRPDKIANAMQQCYDCGYNPRFSQAGGEGGLPSDASGPAQPARQLAEGGAGGVSQFSPSTIVGRL